MKRIALALGVLLFAAGCGAAPTATPTARPEPTTIPTEIPLATELPTNTPLPPSPTVAPSETPMPATNTPIPPTNTLEPTATNTRLPVTPRPTDTPMPTEVVLRFGKPELIEPHAGDTRVLGKDAMVFRFAPLGVLGQNECYLLTVQIINLADPDRRFGQLSYATNCNHVPEGNKPAEFILLPQRLGTPDYEGLVAIASTTTPSNAYLVRWWVQVVEFTGTDPYNVAPSQIIPLSPESEIVEFNLVSP